MKTLMKWIGIILGVLVVIILVSATFGYVRGSSYLTKEYDYELTPINIPTDADSTNNGEYIATSLLACTECHGKDFAGKELFSEPSFAIVYSPNLTSGKGGIGSSYSDEDYVRSIRHGIRPDGKSLVVMPSHYYNQLSADDVGDIVAFLKNLQPVDNEFPESQIMPMMRIMLGLGVLPPDDLNEFFPATAIDHGDNAPPSAPAKGVTVEWGEYRALICTACHGENLAGRPYDPEYEEMAAANLTPGGELKDYSLDDFIATIRTGVTPSGRPLNSEEMPWESFALATDEDLTAIFMYLQSLPALENNE